MQKEDIEMATGQLPPTPPTPLKSPTPEAKDDSKSSGRTLGDVVHSILTYPQYMLMFLLFCGAISVSGMALLWAFNHVFHLQPSEIEFGDKGYNVVFQQVETGTGNGEYFVIVSPEGWQKTSIPVRAGDQLTFSASGRICIDVGDILDKVRNRKDFEKQIAEEKGIRADDPNETRAPEDFFTEDQKRLLVPNRPWVGPDGFNLDNPQFKPSFLSRKNRYLLPPGIPAGALAAEIVSGVNEPLQKDAFFVGTSSNLSAPNNGELWFTVNDVQFNDPNNKNLFYNDNIGNFWVKVSVKHS